MRKRIDRPEVVKYLDKISVLAQATDYEAAHKAEDELHERVLYTITTFHGQDIAAEAASLARLALTSKRIRFPRYMS